MVARRRFSQEFKLEAVQLVKGRGVSVAQAARDLGVHENVLRIWVKQLPAEAQAGLAGTGLMAAQAELARLRKENAKLRMERDILKKAVVRSTGRSNSFIKRSSWRRVTQGFSWSHVHALRDRVEPLLRHDR